MSVYVVALLIGVVAGLRAMTAPAAVAWAADAGKLALRGTSLGFVDNAIVAYVFTFLALAELITDQLPRTPSRTVPAQFGTRIFMGGLSGAILGVSAGARANAADGAPRATTVGPLLLGASAGMAGAVLGTLGGVRLRALMAKAFGRDWPAALIEDLIAVGGAAVLMAALP